MFSLDVFSRIPVYEQIIRQAEDFISKGILKPGDKIPSVRNLSVTLSVNPNTIQKAYSELDREGIIFSAPGKGCFVSENAKELVNSKKREKSEDLYSLLRELALAGTAKADILSMVDEIFDKKEEK